MGYLAVCSLISKYLGNFSNVFLLSMSSLIPLRSENIRDVISVLLNLQNVCFMAQNIVDLAECSV